MGTEVGVGFVRLIPSMKGFGAEVKSGLDDELPPAAQGPGERSGRKFGQGFATGLGSAGSAISSAGDKAALGVTIPLLGAGAAALKASADFNAGMANIATLIPGNAERIDEMKTGIRELSVATGKGTDDMADGMYNVVSAFGDGADSFQILEVNAKAAKAGLADTTDAINLTSAVTKGYGDTSGDAVQKAADLALMTVRLGQTDFPQLASSIGSVIPMASSLGVQQEELFGAMATFTGVTGTASEVSTQMRGALVGLQAPTADAAKALEEAGFASGQAAVEELGLAGAIGILTDASEASGKPLQKFLSSVEGQTFAMGLAGAQADDYETKLAAMADVAGVTDTAFNEATQGVNAQGFAMEQAKVKAQVMAQQLGDGLGPALVVVMDNLAPVIETVGQLATRFAEADPETQKMIVAGAGIVAAMGPVASILGRVTSAVAGSIKGVISLGKGMISIAKFGGRAVMATGRAAMAFGRLGLAALKAGAQVVKAGLQMALSAARTAAKVVAQIALQVAKWVVLGVQSLIQAAKVALAWIISMGPIALVIAAVIGLVVLIIKNWDKIVEVTKALGQKIADIFMAAINWVKSNWPIILAIITGPIGLAVLAIAKNWDTIKAGMAAVKDFIGARISDIVGFFSKLPGRIIGFITRIVNIHREKFNAAKRIVTKMITDLVNAFRRLPGRIRSAFGSLASAMSGPFRKAFSAIKSLWNRTVGGFGFSLPDWIPGVGGKSFKIPKMHDGGIVGGRGEQLTLLEAGEGVFTQEQMAAIGSTTVSAAPSETTVVISAANLDRALLEWLRRAVRVQGRGDVQVALGQSRT